MRAIAEDLRAAVARAVGVLRALDERSSARPLGPGRWSAREVLGHLIDSASINHQRFVRARFQQGLSFPGYDQDRWVEAQRYAEAPWEELVELWRLANLHLARVLEATPDALARRSVTDHNFDAIAFRAVPAGHATTLAYLASDYVEHLRHHLRALGAA